MENLTPWGQGWVRMLRLTSLIRLMIPRSTGKCLAFAAAVEHVEAHGEGTELARKCRVAKDAESRPPRLRRQSIQKLKVRHGPCIAGWSAAIEPTRPLLPRFVLLEPGNAMTKRPPGRPARYTFWRLGRFTAKPRAGADRMKSTTSDGALT